MRIRAIVVDIDGTVTDYDKRLDSTGIRALRRAEQAGYPVITASGNVAPVSKAFASFVGLGGPIVSEGGGVVHSNDMTHHKVLFSRKRPDAAVRYLRKQGFDARLTWSDPWRVSEVALQLNLDEEEVRQAISGWNLDVLTTRFAMHIAEKGLDKYTGIRAALPFMTPRPRPSELLALGDSNNDVKMFERLGVSGCVGNGMPRAKAAADFVAKKRFGKGVEEILQHFGII